MFIKFCPECGQKAEDSFKFCPSCGLKFNREEATEYPTGQGSSSHKGLEGLGSPIQDFHEFTYGQDDPSCSPLTKMMQSQDNSSCSPGKGGNPNCSPRSPMTSEHFTRNALKRKSSSASEKEDMDFSPSMYESKGATSPMTKKGKNIKLEALPENEILSDNSSTEWVLTKVLGQEKTGILYEAHSKLKTDKKEHCILKLDKGNKKRNPNFTSAEVRQLVTKVMDRLYPIDRQLQSHERTIIWVEICNELNAFSQQLNPRPPIRNLGIIKKRWQDFKTMLKKKIAERRKYSPESGAGPMPDYLKITEVEKLALRCIQDQEIVGVGDQDTDMETSTRYMLSVPIEAEHSETGPDEQYEMASPPPLPPDAYSPILKEEEPWEEQHMAEITEKNVHELQDFKCMWEERAQVNWRQHETVERETYRHNEAMEGEMSRHNEDMEREMSRHNEDIERETYRHNEAVEQKLDRIAGMLRLLVAQQSEASTSATNTPTECSSRGRKRPTK